jgi:hypothetical protein
MVWMQYEWHNGIWMIWVRRVVRESRVIRRFGAGSWWLLSRAARTSFGIGSSVEKYWPVTISVRPLSSLCPSPITVKSLSWIILPRQINWPLFVIALSSSVLEFKCQISTCLSSATYGTSRLLDFYWLTTSPYPSFINHSAWGIFHLFLWPGPISADEGCGWLVSSGTLIVWPRLTASPFPRLTWLSGIRCHQPRLRNLWISTTSVSLRVKRNQVFRCCIWLYSFKSSLYLLRLIFWRESFLFVALSSTKSVTPTAVP